MTKHQRILANTLLAAIRELLATSAQSEHLDTGDVLTVLGAAEGFLSNLTGDA